LIGVWGNGGWFTDSGNGGIRRPALGPRNLKSSPICCLQQIPGAALNALASVRAKWLPTLWV
jgi:hypothetical protein